MASYISIHIIQLIPAPLHLEPAVRAYHTMHLYLFASLLCEFIWYIGIRHQLKIRWTVDDREKGFGIIGCHDSIVRDIRHQLTYALRHLQTRIAIVR